MNVVQPSARHVGPRIALGVGLVLVVIGSLLLDIVGELLHANGAFVAGVAAIGVGAISLAAACEAFWLSTAAKLSWRDGVRGIVLALLLLVSGGLLVQVLYRTGSGAYEMFVASAVPLSLCMAIAYVGARWIVVRFGVRRA